MRGTPRGVPATRMRKRIIPADAGNTFRVSDTVSRRNGIIPADAGNTRSHGLKAFAGKDHPRGCGEHQSRLLSASSQAGSSPRMRGTHKQLCRAMTPVRIIPADAGNTFSRCSCAQGTGDHPRGCGEHRLRYRQGSAHGGSSPRMRGTHRQSGHCT